MPSTAMRIRSWVVTREVVQRGRRERYRSFVDWCGLQPSDRILDIGAGNGRGLEVFNDTNPIVAVDKQAWAGRSLARFPNVVFVQGNATALPFDDNAFDVVFCNSVIEHLPPKDRDAFAREVKRVADRYFIETPNRYFPIEPHYLLPGVQFLPKQVRRRLDQRLNPEEVGIELLTERELRHLFPESTIHRERVAGITKSLMAVRHRLDHPRDDQR